MSGRLQTNEWSLLKNRFDALIHSEGAHDSIEELLDDQIRWRFGDWIARAMADKRDSEMNK